MSQNTAPLVVIERKDSSDHQHHHFHSPNKNLSQPSYIDSGKALVEWYLSLFSALSTLGTLGAGFTLSVVIYSPAPPTTSAFAPATVSTWAAVSSVLFVLTVLVSQGFAQLFRFEQACIAEGVDRDEALVLWGLAGLSLVLQVQVVGAFLFLLMVLAAFEPVVGWVGVALTAGLGVVALVLWGVQASGRKPVARYRRYARARQRRTSQEKGESAATVT